MNPLLLPPRLLLRALDDLHAIALAAGRLEQIEQSLNRTVDSRAAEILAMGDRIDARATEILATVDRLDARAEEILAMGDRMDGRAAEVVEAAREVAREGAAIAELLPVLGRAVEMVQPLEGAVERLGRIADRLPGARPRG